MYLIISVFKPVLYSRPKHVFSFLIMCYLKNFNYELWACGMFRLNTSDYFHLGQYNECNSQKPKCSKVELCL